MGSEDIASEFIFRILNFNILKMKSVIEKEVFAEK